MAIALSINCTGLGDTIAAIPTIRKISQSYETSITVFSNFPDLFLNHPCIKNSFYINDSKKGYKILNTSMQIDATIGNDQITFKNAQIDIRQYHALSLGFTLTPEEMEMDLYIEEEWDVEFKDFAIIHPVQTWASRTWDVNKWQDLITELNNQGTPVIAIGKDTSEVGFHHIDKPIMNINIPYGINLMNHPKSTLPKLRNLFKKAKCIITMDSGMLHLAGTTDTEIIQLGSSIHPYYRAPYRKGSQDYKYSYVGGGCDLHCTSNMKHHLKEWNTIQGVPPLIGCLENKPTFECHPTVKSTMKTITNLKKQNNKLLIITPHLSTGGGPQYILDFLQYKKHEFSDIKLVEMTKFSYHYLIQKNKLIEVLGKENIHTLGEYGVPEDIYIKDKEVLIPLIDDFNPTTIWMNGFPEAYEYRLPPDHIMKKVYAKDRTYKIIGTTHNNSFDFKNKKYIPDEFMFCSPKHIKDSENIDIPKKIWEVPIIKKQRPNRKSTLISLDLDPNKLHVLNVGLVSPNKNQKSIFDIAEKTLEKPIQYHFIGNHCFFDDTGITETQRNLPNCRLWGERSDVDTFMSCMDVYLFPSKKELNPLTIKEALSWNMDVIANYDKNYTDQYKDLPNFQVIQNLDIIKYIISKLNTSILPPITEYQSPPIFFDNFNPQEKNNTQITFHKGVKVEILGDKVSQYTVKCFNQKTNELLHEATIKNNMWTSPNHRYFVDWRIEVWEYGNKIHEKFLDIENKTVLIFFGSKSIGDTIAWFPYVEEFRKTHKCRIICSTFHNEWFESKYPKIKFINPDEPIFSFDITYNIGWFYGEDGKIDMGDHPQTFLPQPLQKTASDILGLNYKEIKPKIKSLPKSPIKEKYVTISTQSTSQCKYWNHPTGWQQVVDFLQSKGYKVAVVDQHREFGVEGFKNTSPTVDYYCNDNSLNEVMSIIKGADFHIGLSSGLSWVAWALNTPVVLISSFTKPYCEFTTNCTRIYNDTPTSGYFNTYKLDPSNWNWYPFRNIHSIEDWHEIENITPDQVINEIDKLS